MQFTLLKITIKEIIDQNYEVHLSESEQNNHIITQGNSLLFDQVERIRGWFSRHISELLLVVAKKNTRQEDHLRRILDQGFSLNGNHYKRFGKSASQSKAGITVFARDDIFEELYRSTQLDIPVDQCVISKYESQRCLVFSTCDLIKQELPNIVVVGEYKKVLKNQYVRYAVKREKQIIDKATGTCKTITVREIEEGTRDIRLSPFDGCGCHEKEFAARTSQYLGLDYTAAGNQIRLPFLKGYSVYVPFREIFQEMGVKAIQDIYGRWHRIDDIDCIWNVSMFKGHSLFQDRYGSDAWDMYLKTLKKYNYPLGISKFSHHIKDLNLKARLNFQYLQCLDLWNDKYVRNSLDKGTPYDILSPENEGAVIKIAKYTTDLFEKIIKGEKFYVCRFLGICGTENDASESVYCKAVLINDAMLRDPAVRQFLRRKLRKYITEAKLGKIYADGFYHTVVGDMVGYLEYAAKREPAGCLREREFFCETLPQGKALSFRSPLMDPSEVNEVHLVSNEATKKWFSQFQDQDLVMINLHDPSLPQQGGMDADGDAVFLCCDPAVTGAKIHKPIVIDIEDKETAGPKPYTAENITEYELMTRDSRIGEITNAATSIENKYTSNENIKKRYDDLSSLLRLYQGKEIDYLKTGLRWQMSAGLRGHLKQLPWFLLYNYPTKLKTYESIRLRNREIANPEDRLIPNGFRSPSPMNELCDYINTWEKKRVIWDQTADDTGPLILNEDLRLDDRRIMRQIRRLINDFSRDYRELAAKMQEEKSEFDFHESDNLLSLYKGKLSDIKGNLSEEELANYVIKTSYANRSINKQLAWLGYGEYILSNLEKNSPGGQSLSITEVMQQTAQSYEYLGKYYLFEENEHYEPIGEDISV